jgi:CRP-like cAMP-binding protein
VTVLQPGDFAGEMSTLRGIPGFTRIRVREGGEILSISEADLRNIVQTDAEVSEIVARSL